MIGTRRSLVRIHPTHLKYPMHFPQLLHQLSQMISAMHKKHNLPLEHSVCAFNVHAAHVYFQFAADDL